MVENEPTIIYSPLRQRISRDGTHVDVEIYRGEDEAFWLLEVVDEENVSTVYDERFDTDQAAFDQVLADIERCGIRAFRKGDLPEDNSPDTVH